MGDLDLAWATVGVHLGDGEADFIIHGDLDIILSTVFTAHFMTSTILTLASIPSGVMHLTDSTRLTDLDMHTTLIMEDLLTKEAEAMVRSEIL